MISLQLDKILKLYKAIAQNPSLTSAQITWLNDSSLIVQSYWSQRNLERSITQKFTVNHFLTPDFKVVTESFPNDVTSELLAKTTEDGEFRAILRSAPSKEKDTNSSKQFIEIWKKNYLFKNYDLSAFDVHGDVYTDGEFGAFEWSEDSTKLLYIAEKKLPKTEPFYKQKLSVKQVQDQSDKEEIIQGNEYIYKPDWGEQLVGKHRPVIVILDILSDSITPVSEIPDYLSPGQVNWVPGDDSIVGVAWKHEPRHLGLIFCTNRESWIFMVKNGQFRKLSADNCSARAPQCNKDGKHLIWLERDLGGPHHNTHRLMHLNLTNPENTPEILIDVVRKSITINKGKQFFGLYNRNFPRNCWSDDSQYIFFSTPQRSNIRSYAFNIETKILTEMDNDTSSLSIQCCKNNVLLFTNTSLLEPTSLVISHFDSNNPDKIKINRISRLNTIIGFENLMYESNEYLYDNEDQVRDFNFTYFGPKSGADKSYPLIVMPHGGPHSSYSNVFSLETSLLALLGFGVLQVNYRGSTGMGCDNIEYLQGRVGNADVKDCVNATQEALKKYPWLDPDRIGLSGGSHGGFLVTHLSGQYNNMYRAVVARNPVIDVAAMFTISDIPDWCAAAINQPYPFPFSEKGNKNAEELVLRMFKCSPIVYVDQVIAPTLICIGKNDLRVPPSQGKHWYHRLKANQVKTKMLVYDDNHPLTAGPVEIDEIINAVLWLMEHLKVKNE